MLPDRRIETLKDIPTDHVDAVVQDFKDSGATEVKKTAQGDGKYTIEAIFEAGSRYPASGEFVA
jgi:hypothetical protein